MNASDHNEFRKLTTRPSSDAGPRGPNGHTPDRLLEALNATIGERFHRLTGLETVVAPISLPGQESSANGMPAHPACAEAADREACEKAWGRHQAELRERPEVHWHRCPKGFLCAVVPVAHDGRCLAACKLVCPDSLAEEEFERHIELLDLLAENFASKEAEAWASRGSAEGTGEETSARDFAAKARHPQVINALKYIEERFAEPGTTVAGIARALGMNTTYLAHLFSQQMGVRMSRYISTLRIEKAKKILETTNHQIKRVAFESGHANADWFSQVFHAHTGLSPRAYRREKRAAASKK